MTLPVARTTRLRKINLRHLSPLKQVKDADQVMADASESDMNRFHTYIYGYEYFM